MTVRRRDSLKVTASQEETLARVGRVLARPGEGYRYVDVTADTSGTRVVTRIKPLRPRMLSTHFEVEVQALGDSCTVNASTCSQWYVLGDIFGLYRGYIADFFAALKAEA